MAFVLRSCNPLLLFQLFGIQVLSSYFLGFGNNGSSLFNPLHLSLYLSLFFTSAFGNFVANWKEVQRKAAAQNSIMPCLGALILALLLILLALLVSTAYSAKMGRSIALFLILHGLNGFILQRIRFAGTFIKAFLISLSVFFILLFDPELKKDLMLIFSIYLFGYQFILISLKNMQYPRSNRDEHAIAEQMVSKAGRFTLLVFLFLYILVLTTCIRLIMMLYFTAPLSYVYLSYHLLCVGIPLFIVLSRMQYETERSELQFLVQATHYAGITLMLSMLFF